MGIEVKQEKWLKECPKCRTKSEENWEFFLINTKWMKAFKVTNPAGIQKFKSRNIDIDIDVNGAVQSAITSEFIQAQLKANKDKLPDIIASLDPVAAEKVIKKILDLFLPDKIDCAVEAYFCANCKSLGAVTKPPAE